MSESAVYAKKTMYKGNSMDRIIKYSFLSSCYIKSKADELTAAMDSMLNQSMPPEQIVLVCDGVISEELDRVIRGFEDKYTDIMTVLRNADNKGLGLALRDGTELCRNEFILRMDMDDISDLRRAEIQIGYLEENPEIDVVGSNIAEFSSDPENIIARRIVPQEHDDIVRYMHKRCPFNHMTVAMRKSALEKAGGYMDWHYNEDSYLWVRMYMSGARFYNFQSDLVSARVDMDTYMRRGGLRYYRSERDLFKYMRKQGIITWMEYQKAKVVRLIVQVLMPNRLRCWVFKHFARN